MMISHLSTPNSPADKAYQLPGAFHLKTGFIQKHDNGRDDQNLNDYDLVAMINLTSQTSGPPPSPLQASFPSSPPAQTKPFVEDLSQTSRLLLLVF